MNLHITGDNKFIDFFIGDIEKLHRTDSNDFLVYVVNGSELKYVKNSRIHKIVLNSAEWDDFFRKEVKKYERIFIHYFDGALYNILVHIAFASKIIWCFYGNDGFLYFPETYFLQKSSAKLAKKMADGKRNIFFKILYPAYLLNRRIFLHSRRRIMKRAFRRVNYFANFLISDYHLMKDEVNLGFKHIEVTLASLETMISTESTLAGNIDFSLGNSILIGNSATVTNNHLEIFEKLPTNEIATRKIYCPLSYGNSDYADIIEEKGRQKFGDNFIALRSFLKLEEYNAILRDCGFVFMNHDRTQGAGNIIVTIYNGAKVFLSTQSGIYHFLRKLGIKVFCTQTDILNNKNVFVPLSQDEILQNRKIIYEYFNQARHEERLVSLLEI